MYRNKVIHINLLSNNYEWNLLNCILQYVNIKDPSKVSYEQKWAFFSPALEMVYKNGSAASETIDSGILSWRANTRTQLIEYYIAWRDRQLLRHACLAGRKGDYASGAMHSRKGRCSLSESDYAKKLLTLSFEMCLL